MQRRALLRTSLVLALLIPGVGMGGGAAVVQDALASLIMLSDPAFPFTALDDAGRPLALATLDFYESGTTIPATLDDGYHYVADADGEFDEIPVETDTAYRVIHKTAAGVLRWDVDPWICTCGEQDPLFRSPINRAADDDGRALAGATLTFLDLSDDPATIYADAELTVPLPNPLKANAAGFFAQPVYYDDSDELHITLHDAAGAEVADYDPYVCECGDASLKLIAVGEVGALGTTWVGSINGASWDEIDQPAGFFSAYDIIWVDELRLWLASGAVGGVGAVARSSDLVTWDVEVLTGLELMRGIAWSPDLEQLVAVEGATGGGAPSKAATSEDGETWATHPMAERHACTWVQWVPQFALYLAGAATGGSSNLRLQTSPDGVTWTVRTSPGSSFDGAHDGTRFIQLPNFMTSGNGSKCYSSTNGTTWAQDTAAVFAAGSSQFPLGIAYGNGTWVVITEGGGNLRVYTSANPMSSWTLSQTIAHSALGTVTSRLRFHPELSLFVFVTDTEIYTSSSGTSFAVAYTGPVADHLTRAGIR